LYLDVDVVTDAVDAAVIVVDIVFDAIATSIDVINMVVAYVADVVVVGGGDSYCCRWYLCC